MKTVCPEGNTMSETESQQTMIERALSLLWKGWSVIPIGKNKKPLGEWKKYQTERATKEEVVAWFTKYPQANLAVVTGKISDIVVVDIDPRHGGSRDVFIGYETVIVETGGGGWHYYFKYKNGIQNFAGIEMGIDIRGDGGYVIVPPSVHESGTPYKWYRSPDSFEVQPLLSVVLEWIEKKGKNKQTQSKWSPDKLNGVGEGQRNESAASVAGKLLLRFKQHEWQTEAWPLLRNWNNANTPPLPEQELRQTFDSIANRERSKTTNIPLLPVVTQSDVSLEYLFQEIDKVFPGKRNLILLAMAVSVSHFIDTKTPLWLMLVGVPASGKTEVVRMLQRIEWVYFLDALTENAFVSGARNDTDDLLPLLDGKTFIIKDFTTTLSQREEVVKKIIGDLTSIYDDSYSKHSASRGTISYKAFFSFLACVTPQALNLHQRYMNQIGPRFLFYRVPSASSEEVEMSFSILWESSEMREELVRIQQLASAYITSIKGKLGTNKLEKESYETKIYLNSLAKFVAKARGTVLTRKANFLNEKNEMVEFYEPVDIQVEEPFRAMLQLRVLARSLAFVKGKTGVTQEELVLVKRVALSSMPADRSLLLSVLVSEAKAWTAKEVSEKLGISHKTAHRQLDELVSLKIISKVEQGYGLANKYLIHSDFQEMVYDGAEFSDLPPAIGGTQTPHHTGDTEQIELSL